jgi:glycosyltransferase involved in cell wall biosynthesis
MPSILSVENTKGWSWGIVIQRLEDTLSEYEFVRVVRGMFPCPNPRCRVVHHKQVDADLASHFDLIMVQNCDSIKLIPDATMTVARVGGLDMSNPDSQRYAKDFQRVAAIVATNEALGEIARAANPNVTVIPNGVDLTIFKPPEECPNFQRHFTMGFAGNIWGGGADYKGWKYYIQASAYLAAQGVNQIYRNHNVNQVAHAEMPEKFYYLLDALVLPSKGEGCSNVVSEALACGVPVLLTKVGYHGEKLEHEKNCLFIERDATNIQEAIERLIAEPELRTTLSMNGIEFAKEHHDVQKVARLYDEVFKAVLAKRKEGKDETALK